MKVCHCLDGWICDTHRDQPWPHDACTGPGTLCLNPSCIVGRVLRAELADQRQDSAWLRTSQLHGLRDPRN
jgi:hypothetical protein